MADKDSDQTGQIVGCAPVAYPWPADAIVVAAGRGRRFGSDENKVLLELGGKPIWQHAVESLQACKRFNHIVLVIRPADHDAVADVAGRLNLHLTPGGDERYDSVLAGLSALRRLTSHADPSSDSETRAESRLVAIHDGARPFISATEIRQVVDTAQTTGAAVLATPIRGTLKRRSPLGQTTTIDRSELWEALTPQVFRLDIINMAYQRWRGRPVTDDAELVERSGFPVTLVPGSPENLKITRAEDLDLARAILSLTPHTNPKL